MPRIFIVPDDEAAIIELGNGALKRYILAACAQEFDETLADVEVEAEPVAALAPASPFDIKRVLEAAVAATETVEISYKWPANGRIAPRSETFGFIPTGCYTANGKSLVRGRQVLPGGNFSLVLELTRIESVVRCDEH